MIASPDEADDSQRVIAALRQENTRLITEQREALERQTATADVLQAINASPGDLAPVFRAILEKAHTLCGAEVGTLNILDNGHIRAVAVHGYPEEVEQMARLPRAITPVVQALLDGERYVHIADQKSSGIEREGAFGRGLAERTNVRTRLLVPLRNEGAFLGFIAANRLDVRLFSEGEITLLESFAAQAVIAMENARLLGDLQARTAELAARNDAYGEQIEHQSATIDVLKAMSASPGDAQPVFELIVRRARELGTGAASALFEYDGTLMHFRAVDRGAMVVSPEADVAVRGVFPMAPTRATYAGRTILDGQILHIRDTDLDPDMRPALRALGYRSILNVPLLRDGAPVGAITLQGMQPGGYSDTQIELLKTFAEQAVIAIRSAETFRELEARTADLQESLEYQTGTSDVLKVISRSNFDLEPVFQAVVETAVRLCRAGQATIYRYVDGEYRWAAGFSLAPEYERIEREARIRPGTGTLVGRVALERRAVQILDAWTDPLYEVKDDAVIGGVRTMLGVPLLRDDVPIGVIGLARTQIEPYTERQIALVSTFAEQAVIAIGSVATFQALQERTAALARSVSELQALEEVLRAVNSSLDLETVLATIISRAVALAQADEGTIYEFDAIDEVFVPKSAFGMSEQRVAQLRERRIRIGETHLGRSAALRAPVHVADVQQDPAASDLGTILQGIHAVLAVPLLREDRVVGGLVIRRRSEGAFAAATVLLMQTFAAQSVLAIENARLFDTAGRARGAAEVALADLRQAQDRLVQSEKMASLGQLTAGIAHEIKNPLNFINNFSALSTELIDELNEMLAAASIDRKLRADIEELTALLRSNLEKVVQHGKRADGIVKNMLLHSREGGGDMRAVDLNATVEEALNLAYHGARAEKPGFDITLVRVYDPAAGLVALYPQEFTRVMLNLIGNGFYAATRRKMSAGEADFDPTLTVTTKVMPDTLAISVRDNGDGIPEHVRARMFEPFFTTKPAGEGTGLGLSLSHDIVVKQHGGSIAVDSEAGGFTEFTVLLPRAGAGVSL